MTDDEQAKQNEREAWERFALKALEFVPIQKNGEVYTAEQMSIRAACVATGLVRERREAFNDLDIWPGSNELADQAHDATKPEPTSTGHFDDALVERLAKSGSPDWDVLPEYVQERRRRHARAILAELASVPCELPTIGATCERLSVVFGTRPLRRTVQLVLEHANDTVAPTLAAKDARLAEFQARFEQDQKALHEAHGHIAAIESRTPANECSNAERQQYEKTIELQKQRIAELETRLKSSEMVRDAQRRNVQKLWDFLRECDDQLFTTWNPTWDLLSRVKARVAELEKRITELTAPVVVDGKTPGQVNQAAFAYSVENHHESKGVPNWEIAAQAVLRAFGNGAGRIRELELRLETIGKWPGAKEALQKARDRMIKTIEQNEADPDNRDPWLSRAAVQRIVDDEIANIKGAKAIKMVANCTVCGCINERAFLDPCVANGKHNFEAS